jgi:hypothetical protein
VLALSVGVCCNILKAQMLPIVEIIKEVARTRQPTVAGANLLAYVLLFSKNDCLESLLGACRKLLKMYTATCCTQRSQLCPVRDCETRPYPTIRNYDTGTTARKPLKPALGIGVVSCRYYFFLILSFSIKSIYQAI